MRRRTLKLTASASALATLGGIALLAFGHDKDARAEAPPRPAERVLVAPSVTEGARDAVSLSFETTGSVSEVLVDAGSVVKKGDLLARLDDRLARAALDEAIATVAATKARRDATFAGARASERAMAEQDLAEVRALVADRNREFERSEQLLVDNAVSRAEVDRNRTAVDVARARELAAEARAKLVHEGSRAEALREATASVEAAEARRREAEILLSHSELRAPCDGLILRRSVEPGEQVTLLPPTVALTLVDASKLRVRAEIDEQDIGLIHVGDGAWATAPAFGERRFTGKVTQVMHAFGRKRITADDPHARNDTRVLEAVIELDGPPNLPIGLRMDAHVVPGASRLVTTAAAAGARR